MLEEQERRIITDSRFSQQNPGDELTLVKADEGLLVYRHGADPLTSRWWAGLNEDERRQSRVEAERYEGLCCGAVRTES